MVLHDFLEYITKNTTTSVLGHSVLGRFCRNPPYCQRAIQRCYEWGCGLQHQWSLQPAVGSNCHHQKWAIWHVQSSQGFKWMQSQLTSDCKTWGMSTESHWWAQSTNATIRETDILSHEGVYKDSYLKWVILVLGSLFDDLKVSTKEDLFDLNLLKNKE